MHCQPHWKSQVYIWLKNKQPCLLCDEASNHCSAICLPCEKELPWLDAGCPVCALPQPFAHTLCAQCLKQRPAFSSVLAPWTYSFPVDSLISRFKYRENWPFGRLLAELYSQWLHDRFDQGLVRPDFLLPVPLTARRLRQRGFNQAAMLANGLSKHLALPCNERLLRRIKEVPSQQQLTARARKRNLLDAFTLSDALAIEGLHLALVDDVLTTGATAEVLARLLLKAGARRVDVYCLARTPKPGDTT